MFKHTKEDSFFAAFKRVFSSANFVTGNKGLLKYFVLPFLINIIILSSVFYFSYSSAVPVLKNLLAGDAWYLKMLSMMVAPVIIVLLTLGTVILYSAVGGIAAAPFLDLLSENVERRAGVPESSEGFSMLNLLKDIYRALMNTIKLLVIIIIINLLLLILFIIPGGSFIYAFTSFFTSIFFYGFQFYDYPLERLKLSFSGKIKTCWRWRRSVAGTGAAFFLLSFIPIIGFLGLNLATVGATLTYAERMRKSITGGNSR
jgi:CysZ protein